MNAFQRMFIEYVDDFLVVALMEREIILRNEGLFETAKGIRNFIAYLRTLTLRKKIEWLKLGVNDLNTIFANKKAKIVSKSRSQFTWLLNPPTCKVTIEFIDNAQFALHISPPLSENESAMLVAQTGMVVDESALTPSRNQHEKDGRNMSIFLPNPYCLTPNLSPLRALNERQAP